MIIVMAALAWTLVLQPAPAELAETNKMPLNQLLGRSLFSLHNWSEEAEVEGTEKPMLEMSTDKNQYTGSDSLTLIIKNPGNDVFFFGYPYEIERRLNGEWRKVPPKEEQFFIMVAIYLKPGEVWKQDIILDGLEDGIYRIVKQVNNETRDSKHTLYAEFEVKNQAVE
ncbi:immunoglobulin-like domain-containing protein [Paenibacillus senegalensis]|uniref:immunoglobulin-like domain-containing protein n=1 Tax=Paenibacillus senegalensis TaxID=1465766 RepID=UPI0002883223|nr:immunoglobulin-like domain-containing protein [Paenibacillus senegalensis]